MPAQGTLAKPAQGERLYDSRLGRRFSRQTNRYVNEHEKARIKATAPRIARELLQKALTACAAGSPKRVELEIGINTELPTTWNFYENQVTQQLRLLGAYGTVEIFATEDEPSTIAFRLRLLKVRPS